MITLAAVRDEVARIIRWDQDGPSDPEAVHGRQDDLYEAVLRAVVAGDPDATTMAAECIRVAESPGIRWFA
jgi:hypothetical protein